MRDLRQPAPPTQNDGGMFRQDPLPKPTLIYIKRRAAPGRRSACPASLRPLRGDTSRCLADF